MIVPQFGEKLDMALDQKGKSQNWLSNEVGISARHMSRLKRPGSKIPSDLIEKICASLNVPRTYFIDIPQPHATEFIPIPLREAGGGMGGGYHSGSKRIESYISLRRDFLLTKTSNFDALSFIHAAGESMFPTIPPDAAVLIDESQTEPINGKIFYVMLNNAFLIKRLEVRDGKVIAIVSDNGCKREELGEGDNLQILGKAILQQTLL